MQCPASWHESWQMLKAFGKNDWHAQKIAWPSIAPLSGPILRRSRVLHAQDRRAVRRFLLWWLRCQSSRINSASKLNLQAIALIEKIAGTESTTNTASTISMITSARDSGVA